MALVTWHNTHYQRLRPYCENRTMLVLGHHKMDCYPPEQQSYNYIFGCSSAQTLDLDGGDLRLDLEDGDFTEYRQSFDVVLNIGTLEHVWDAHTAHCNAASMVREGGYYIGHAPVKGYYAHGHHVTWDKSILAFFAKNGFSHRDSWLLEEIQGSILWHVEQRNTVVSHWLKPKQIWVNGDTRDPI